MEIFYCMHYLVCMHVCLLTWYCMNVFWVFSVFAFKPSRTYWIDISNIPKEQKQHLKRTYFWNFYIIDFIFWLWTISNILNAHIKHTKIQKTCSEKNMFFDIFGFSFFGSKPFQTSWTHISNIPKYKKRVLKKKYFFDIFGFSFLALSHLCKLDFFKGAVL